MDKIKVSSCIITYNHEGFLRECLESAINQKVNFDYEIVIGQDCSTDGTHQICLEYANKYPDLIKYYPRENNLGMIGNWLSTIGQCKGKYIALCEGDDYWTDPLKLQKQVDFLEKNEDYVLTFHPVKILNLDGSLVEDFITIVPDNYETQETLAHLGNYIHTPSVVFKNILNKFPPEFYISPIADYFLYMLLTNQGKIKMLEDRMAIYRNEVGVHSTLTAIKKNRDWNLTLTLIVSGIENFEIKKIILDRLYPKITNMVVLENQNKINFKKFIKLISPPILLKVKNKIFK